jgi:hypothetical protein
METERFKLKDLGFGLIVPLLVGILILIFPIVLRPLLDNAFPAQSMMNPNGSPYAFLTVVFTHGFASMIVLAVPMVLGLLWNKWAGGAAGFITGGLYYVAYAGYNTQYSIDIAIQTYNSALASGADVGTSLSYFMSTMPPNLYADPSFLGDWIVGAVLIGYITGALANGSFNFKRMLGAGLTASIAVAVIQFILNTQFSAGAWMARADMGLALFQVMLPGVLLGVVIPIIAKVMTWYGLQPSRH